MPIHYAKLFDEVFINSKLKIQEVKKLFIAGWASL